MRQTDGVDLVVDVQALDVLAVIDVDNVDKVVNCGVLIADQHFGVEDLVVLEDLVDHLLVKTAFGRRLEVDLHSTGLLGLQVNVALDMLVVTCAELALGSLRWVLVQPDSNCEEFSFEQTPLLGLLCGIEDHADQITRLCCTDDLASATLAFGGTFDDTRKIEDLNLSTAIFEYTGDSSQSSESV